MNIFVVDRDPLIAADMLCDQHIVSQFKESIQMLVASALFNGCSPSMMPLTKAGTHNRGGYKHHPCTVWASESRANWMWLLLHTVGLSKHMIDRFDNDHSILHEQMRTLWTNSAQIQMRFPDIPQTPFARAMNQSKGENLDLIDPTRHTVVEAYREYYRRDKVGFAKWTKGVPAPYWWQ
jgi:hypothetical protein